MTPDSSRVRKSQYSKLAKSKSLRMSALKAKSKKLAIKRSKRITKATTNKFFHVRVPNEKKPS